MYQNILASVQARLNTMEIIPVDTTTHKSDKLDGIPSSHYYLRRFLVYRIKQQIFNAISSFKLSEGDFIVDNYFSFVLNPLYSTISSLPKKIFVCGYCKQPFFTPAQYLKHCYLEDCPINHPRSTYFFKVKSTSKNIQNQDLKTILSKKQLTSLIKTDYCRNYLFFSHYQNLNEEGAQKFNPGKGRCVLCQKQITKYHFTIKYHAVLNCPARLSPEDKKSYKVIYLDQPLEVFVEEIINFYLNFNILVLTQEKSVLKIFQNPKKISKQRFYCSHCRINFSKENDFLVHLIFNCSQINGNNHNSSHYLSLQNLNEHSKNGNHPHINKYGIPQNILKQNSLGSQLVTAWQEKINQHYSHLREIFQEVYFCGQCLNHFLTSKLYLAHCIRYKCALNHPKSSHQFLSLKDQSTLKNQNISKQNLQDAIKKILYDCYLLNKIKFRVDRKEDMNYFSSGERIRYICGSCEKNVLPKEKFFEHVFTICHSEDHPKTSHTFKVKNPQLSDGEYQELIFKNFYLRKIAESTVGYKYVLSKNEKIKFQGKYYCGFCETIFDSVEEYVYHSITVCQSLEDLKSSHFIKKLYYPLTDLQNLCQNLIEEIDNNFNSFIKNSRKVRPKTERQIKLPITQLLDQSQEKDQGRDPQIKQNPRVGRENQKQQIKIVQLAQQNENIEVNNFLTSQLKFSGNQMPQNPQFEAQSVFQRRFLKFNVGCVLPSNTKFYCGLCGINFKKDRKFIDHLQEICKAFQHPKSSHFYIPSKRIHQINSKTTFNWNLLSETVFPEEYSVYRLQKDQKFECGCGQKDLVTNLSYHRKYHNYYEVKRQHMTIIDIRLAGYSRNLSHLFLPLTIENTNSAHDFVCPCKPLKKMEFDVFVKHVIKRHDGKTPKFYMKVPNA